MPTEKKTPQPDEGAPDLRAAFESWALHTPPDERTNWEVYQAGARAGLAILDLRDDVIATLRGQIADLQALCDERGRRLYGDDGQAPAEAHDNVLVPLAVLEDASSAIGNFVSDHGWGDSDMQALDNLDAYIAQHKAKPQPKGTAPLELTCSHANRSYCALYEPQASRHRPSAEWYRAKIAETEGLDDNMPCGALAAQAPAPVAESSGARLALCPFCGRRPVLTVRPDNAEATSYFAAVACFCDGYAACAHKDATAAEADEAERLVREKWNRRATASPAVGDEPPGLKLVPLEPTAEMIAAWPNNRHGSGHEAAIYRAMLAAAPSASPAAPLAWMYEHDGSLDEPILTVSRWPECREPWNETPLDALALAKHAIEKVWLDAVGTGHGEHSISEAARARVEFAAEALKLGLRLPGALRNTGAESPTKENS